jgi:hypothetical protein
MEKIRWVQIEVEVKYITPTEKNYKIKNALGRERLKESLKQFGLASSVTCNWRKSVGDIKNVMLIDGNSRLEEAKENGAKKIWVSLPSRKLSAKEFAEMSAMFDLAKAGDVDLERIQGDLGTARDFYEKWNLQVPSHLLDKLGAKQAREYKETKTEKKKLALSKITPDQNLNEMVMIQLVYNPKQYDEFRKHEARLAAKLKTKTTAELVLKLISKN